MVSAFEVEEQQQKESGTEVEMEEESQGPIGDRGLQGTSVKEQRE